MKVLYVAWLFPPFAGAGVYRTVANCRWLVEQGHEVTVLTADRSFYELNTPIDQEYGSDLLARLRVVRVPFPDPRDPVITRWPSDKGHHRKDWEDAEKARNFSLFPERAYGGWLHRIQAAAMRLQRQECFDLCVASGSAYVAYAAADILNTMAGVPYVLDDRDSFLFDLMTGEPKPGYDRLFPWWRTLVERALEVWVVNPPIRELYAKITPEFAAKIMVVENGWDADSLNQAGITGRSDTPVRVSYVGLVHRNALLEEILTGWRNARTSLGKGAELQFVGSLGHRESGTKQKNMFRDNPGIQLTGPVERHSLTEVYAQSTALIFFMGGQASFTGSKVYEYVATGLPIASVVPNEHDSRRILEGYPRIHAGTLDDPSTWSQAIVSACADGMGAGTAARLEMAQRFGRTWQRTAQLEPAWQRIQSMLTDSGSAG